MNPGDRNEFSGLEPDRYPELSKDISAAYEIAGPTLNRIYDEATALARRARRAQLGAIIGGVSAIGIGVSALLSGFAPLFAFEALTLILLAASVFAAARGGWHRKALRRRWVSERMVGEAFRYVGRVGAYGGASGRGAALAERLSALERAAREIDA